MQKESTRGLLFQLALPIFFEASLWTIMGTIDAWMLSSISMDVLGAIGSAGVILGLIGTVIGFISIGTMIRASQLLGAHDLNSQKKLYFSSLMANGLFGLLLFTITFFGAPYILNLVGTQPDLYANTFTYLRMISFTFLFIPLTDVNSSIIRGHGEMKTNLLLALIANILNLIGNSLAIFVFHAGVFGVALATIISRLMVFIASFMIVQQRLHFGQPWENLHLFDWPTIKAVLRIGIPSAFEGLIYMVVQMFIQSYVNSISPLAVSVRALAATLAGYLFIISAALAQANQILVGFRIGAKQYKEAREISFMTARYSVPVTIVGSLIFYFFAEVIFGFFTADIAAQALAKQVFLIDIAVEIGRAVNFIFGGALKSSGDANFIVKVSLISMPLFGIVLGYILVVVLPLGLVGIWITYALDELVRCAFYMLRYKSTKWEGLHLSKSSQEAI